jgi:hypothetical protein
MKLDFLNDILMEQRTGAQPHPEDSIFDGSAAAQQALSSLLYVIKNPGTVTIKWDGFPALIFGRLPDGRFTIRCLLVVQQTGKNMTVKNVQVN